MEPRAPIDVSIIIVSYNTREFIGACLQALAERARDVALEVIVVDNASRDGSVEMIRSGVPRGRGWSRTPPTSDTPGRSTRG